MVTTRPKTWRFSSTGSRKCQLEVDLWPPTTINFTPLPRAPCCVYMCSNYLFRINWNKFYLYHYLPLHQPYVHLDSDYIYWYICLCVENWIVWSTWYKLHVCTFIDRSDDKIHGKTQEDLSSEVVLKELLVTNKIKWAVSEMIIWMDHIWAQSLRKIK